MKRLKKKLKTCCTRAGAKYDTMSIEIWIERGLLQSGKERKAAIYHHQG